MSVRLVSSARNLRESFKNPQMANGTSSTIPTSSGISVYTATSDVSQQSRSLDPMSPMSGTGSNPSLSRQGSILRSSSSNSNLRRAKSIQKKGLISKVFSEAETEQNMAMPDLSMEMTLLIVKRCVKEIRERGLTTKGILRQVQMGQSQKVILNTIRMILDDDATTELSPLHRIDIHLVAHAMKWAIRYSEETLVTYDDYRVLYLDQERNFSKFIKDLPPTNRTILLDLFSLCADVTLLAHLNGMTLVVVAKAISLSIMAEPEREFTTFDASLQQRNLWGAACEDLLRAFLRIKTQYDLAKIDQPDDWDENTYFCSETRVLKSARQEATAGMRVQMPYHNLPSRLDISLPSSAGSSMPMSATTPRSFANANGYFDSILTPPAMSPLSHAGGVFGGSLSRSQSMAKSNMSMSRPTSPLPASPRPTSPYYEEERTEYEEIMQDQSHLYRLRQQESASNQFLRPAAVVNRRRSSVADMESLYVKENDPEAPDAEEGYDSDPEVTYANESEESHDTLICDFADGLGWDFNRHIEMQSEELPSLSGFQKDSTQRGGAYMDKNGVTRSNSASSNGSGLGANGPPAGPFRNIRDLPRDKLTSMRMRQMQENQPNLYQALSRAQSQQEVLGNGQVSGSSSPQNSLYRAANSNNARIGQVIQNSTVRTSPSMRPQRARRNSALRRSMTVDPFSLGGMGIGMRTSPRRPSEIYSEPVILHPQQLQTDGQSMIDFVVNDPYLHLPDIHDEEQVPARASSEFSLQSSPMDLEGLPVQPRRRSQMTLGDRPKSMMDLNARDMSSFAGIGPRSHSPQPMGRTLALPTEQSMFRSSSPANVHPPERSFEVLSRPKNVEVNVFFAPIPTSGPTSPRGEVKSKFQESFPERPVSPPPGYVSNGSSNTRSNSSSASSPRQKGAPNRSFSTGGNRPALQQSVTFSSSSNSSHQLSVDTGISNKSKTPGFIRALSFKKLRNKQSDDQLKPMKINSQVAGAGAASAPPTAAVAASPSVSIEPPRLELNFIDDIMGAVVNAGQDQEDSILSPAPATAPAFMQLNGNGTSDSWRRMAQESFPLSSGSSASIASTITTTTATTEATSGSSSNTGSNISGSGIIRAKATFNGARRASTASIVVGSLSPTREQHRRKTSRSPLMTAAATSAYANAAAKKKNGMALSPPASPLSSGGRAKKASLPVAVNDIVSGEAIVSDSSYTTDDSGAASNEEEDQSMTDPSSVSSPSLKSPSLNGSKSPKESAQETPSSPINRASIPKKQAVDENNKAQVQHRFSTATLLKDGKLYYQVQWDQFSELGFNSEFITEPKQYLSGLQMSSSMVGMSQEDPQKQSSLNAAAAATVEENGEQSQNQQQQQQQQRASANSDLPGQPPRLGQVNPLMPKKSHLRQKTQDQGPSPAQRAAALKAAQESFLALTKDPKAMAALKAEASSNSGRSGQATIISSGSFVHGSTMPLLDSVPRAANSSPESPRMMNPNARAKTMPSGGSGIGGSGLGSSQSLSSLDKQRSKKGGLFGKKFKVSKKTTNASSTNSPSSGLPSAANGGGNRKRRLLPLGVRRQDVMTRTVERMDEVFPWMCIEHMAGQESGWVMLEPVQDGAVGWVIIDKLEEEITKYQSEARQQEQMEQVEFGVDNQQQQQQQQTMQEQQEQKPVHPFESQAALQVEVA